MTKRILLVVAAAALLLLASALAGVLRPTDALSSKAPKHGHRDRSYDVGLWGDLPYTDEQATVGVPNMIAEMNHTRLAFTVFDGDIKNGSTPCDDVVYTNAIARFNSFARPTVYVPGDNEWTDCHRVNNGSYDPLERLAHIRTTMAATPFSFGQDTMKLDRQADYPENVRWVRGGVVWVALNVQGSNNNHMSPEAIALSEAPRSNRTDADRAAAEAEFQARDAADRSWLGDTFALATEIHAAGVAVVIQADPAFEITDPAIRAIPGVNGQDGFDAFVGELRTQTVAFGKPVLLVHGDSHYFRIDKPLLDDNGARVMRFTRLETFGETDPHWVRLTVDRDDPDVFSAKAEVVDANVAPSGRRPRRVRRRGAASGRSGSRPR